MWFRVHITELDSWSPVHCSSGPTAYCTVYGQGAGEGFGFFSPNEFQALTPPPPPPPHSSLPAALV